MYPKKNKPIITVVTVVFNGLEFLEETIQSVINQTYQDVEYIIIDGGSTDGTLDVIKKYEDKIDCWVSEPDAGIYDAMNKGIALATGEWVNFMNAGDAFYSSNTLAMVFKNKKYNEDILFGDVNIIYPDFSRVQRAGSPRNLWRGMQFCHQSVFVRAAIHKLSIFNVADLIAADFQFYFLAYKKNIKFKYIDSLIASVIIGGVSDLNRLRTIEAWRDVVCAAGCTYTIRLYYKYLVINMTIRSYIKQIVPVGIKNVIIKNK